MGKIHKLCIHIDEHDVTKYFQWWLAFFKLRWRNTFWMKYFITSTKTIGELGLGVLRQIISNKLSSKTYQNKAFFLIVPDFFLGGGGCHVGIVHVPFVWDKGIYLTRKPRWNVNSLFFYLYCVHLRNKS